MIAFLIFLLGLGVPGGASALLGEVRSHQEAYLEVVVVPDSGGRMVATAIRFPAGSAEDPIGSEGTAFLLGRVLEGEGEGRLAPFGARLSVEVRPEEFMVSMTVRPDRWREAMGELVGLLHEGDLPDAELGGLKDAVLEQLQFEEGAPVRGFERERAALLRGSDHRAARSPQGTRSTVVSLGRDELASFRADHLVPGQARVAVVGPVDEDEVRRVLPGPVRTVREGGGWDGGESERQVVVDPQPPEERPDAEEGTGDDGTPGFEGSPVDAVAALPPAPSMALYREESDSPLRVPTASSGSLAWEAGDRVVVDRQLTSTWIAVAFPFPPGTPSVLLEFLGHLVYEALTPSPPDPGLYEAGVTVEWVAQSPVLMVSASVDPRITSRWEDRLTGSLEALSEGAPTGSFFELTRRRFRSALFLELSVPEARARWVTRKLAQGEDPIPDLQREIWRFRPGAVAEAARAAGPPRVLLFGPRDMMGR